MTSHQFDAAEPLGEAAVPGLRNFRDAGCGVLRPGVLYRSASLDELTPAGARRLAELGVGTVVDLRRAAELARWPNRLHGLDADAVHLPLFQDEDRSPRPPDQSPDRAATYRWMAETGGPAIAGLVRRLAEARGRAVLVHCAVGKDRTGLGVAVVQSVAGLPLGEVVSDYLRSNAALGLDGGPVAFVDEEGVEQLSHPVVADYLLGALDRMRGLHGSLEGYLRAHGISDAELVAVHAALAP